MYAITIQRPWTWAILLPDIGELQPDGCHLPPKRVENRTWAPPAAVLGRHIAIHAGQAYDHAGAAWIREQFGVYPPAPDVCPTGLVGCCCISGVCNTSPDPWFCGPVGWDLSSVTPFVEPIAANGHLGFWALSKEQEAAVWEQWYEQHAKDCPGRFTSFALHGGMHDIE